MRLYALCAAALMVAAPLSARQLTFYIGDTPVEEGSTVTLTDFTFVAGDYNQMDPHLYLYSDLVVTNVTITADCTTGQTVQLCANGTCMTGVKITKEGVGIGSDSRIPMQFEYVEWDPEAKGFPVVATDFKAVDEDHPDVTASFTLVMDGPAGVATVIGGDSAFRAVEGGIEYSFDAPVEVGLYTLAGEKVLCKTLEGTGTIPTSSIPSGIYLYKAGGKSGKIFIR